MAFLRKESSVRKGEIAESTMTGLECDIMSCQTANSSVSLCCDPLTIRCRDPPSICWNVRARREFSGGRLRLDDFSSCCTHILVDVIHQMRKVGAIERRNKGRDHCVVKAVPHLKDLAACCRKFFLIGRQGSVTLPPYAHIYVPGWYHYRPPTTD